jgi:hypothetical protein
MQKERHINLSTYCKYLIYIHIYIYIYVERERERERERENSVSNISLNLSILDCGSIHSSLLHADCVKSLSLLYNFFIYMGFHCHLHPAQTEKWKRHHQVLEWCLLNFNLSVTSQQETLRILCSRGWGEEQSSLQHWATHIVAKYHCCEIWWDIECMDLWLPLGLSRHSKAKMMT